MILHNGEFTNPKKSIGINGKFLSVPIENSKVKGVHRVALELSNALAALGYENHSSLDGRAVELLLPYDANTDEVDSARARVVRPLRHIGWEQLTLPMKCRDNILLNLCNLGPVMARHAITIIHDVQVYQSPKSYSFGFRTWYKSLLPMIGRRHRCIITVSEFARQQIAGSGICDLSKIEVVHNGGDHIRRVAADFGIVDTLGVSDGHFVVGLANVQAHKNVKILLECFAAPEMREVPLVLFGPAGPSDFRALGCLVPPNVKFAGPVSDAALSALFQRAACLAFPSLTEGFGLPPLEAMMMGCPVIAAARGAVPEVCSDAALYADPDDPAAWRRAILDLLGNPALAADLREKGLHRAEQFTWRSAAIRMAKIINSYA